MRLKKKFVKFNTVNEYRKGVLRALDLYTSKAGNNVDTSDYSKYNFLNNYKLVTNGSHLFYNKNILFNEPVFIYENNRYMIYLEAFYKTKALIQYRRRLSKSKIGKSANIISGTDLSSFFKSNEVFCNIVCLNRLTNSAYIYADYSFYKKYKNMLFSRNYNLWLDMLKITNLFVRNMLDPKSFLALLSHLFKYLNKRKHNKFIYFVTSLFDYLIKTYPTHLLGLQLTISGRLLSKPRSSIINIKSGTLHLTSISVSEELKSSQMHVYTLYGAFGLKLYVNYK